jgi:hypothetical protein
MRLPRVLLLTSLIPRRAGFSYHIIRIDDSSTASLREHLPGAFAFIQQALQRQQGVLVHCYAGIFRQLLMSNRSLLAFIGLLLFCERFSSS